MHSKAATPLPPAQVQLVRGQEAMNLLTDVAFGREWAGLLAACPWGTVFQSPGFVAPWFDVYHDQFEPLFVVARAADGALVGAIFLCRHRVTGELGFVGTNQAEYHTFLVDGYDPAVFLESAVRLLRSLDAPLGLRFHFMAPATPVEWILDSAALGFQVQSQDHGRPILELTDPEVVNGPLQKKRHKGRVARLGKAGGGEVRLVQLHNSAELLPYLDEIIAHCDLRQGAVNRNTPFRSDPRKRDFYLRMLDEPGQMHATVLLAGDRLAAAHIGPVNGRQVVFGLIVHSALFAQHSPGKLLVLLLGKLLAEQGFEALDLTPGEGYKNQFATRSDSVLSVQLHWDAQRFRRERFRAGLRGAAVRLARSVGVTKDAAERLMAHRNRLLNWARWPHMTKVLGQRLFELGWKRVEYRIYLAPRELLASRHGSANRLRRLQVADLLEFAPESGLPDDYHAFLSHALTRLERGQVCYTCAEAGRLLHYSWLIPSAPECGTGLGHAPLRFAEASAVLWDDYTHPDGRGRGFHTESIRRRVEDVKQESPSRNAFVGVHADNRASRLNYERLGFVHVATAWYLRRGGRVTRWVEVPASSGFYFAPPDGAGATGANQASPDPASALGDD